jgi:hypothetical protein
MVILRATRKLLASLPVSSLPVAPSDTALGDWYVNRLVVDRQPLLILLSSRSLLAVLTPARAVRTLPNRLPALIASRLQQLGVAERLVDAEIRAMAPVVIAKTEDRSVLGFLVDFAKMIPYYLEAGAWDETTLPFVEAKLARTPCHAGKRFEEVIFPDRAAPKLLAARWHGA